MIGMVAFPSVNRPGCRHFRLFPSGPMPVREQMSQVDKSAKWAPVEEGMPLRRESPLRRQAGTSARSTGTTPRQMKAGREHSPNGITSFTPSEAARFSAALNRSRRILAAWA